MRKESRIVEIDAVSGLATQVAIDRIGITEYSASADGRTIAYLSVSEATAKDDPLLDKNQVARGFSLPSDFGDRVWNGSGAVLAWEGVGGLRLHFSREEGAQPVWASHEVELPKDALNDDGKGSGSGFAYALSLAPDGRFLAFTYRMKNPPDSWMKSRTVRAYLDQDGVMPHGLALYDLTLRQFVDVPKIPFPRSVWWSETATLSLLSLPLRLGPSGRRRMPLQGKTPRRCPELSIYLRSTSRPRRCPRFSLQVRPSVVPIRLSPAAKSGSDDD